MSRRQSRVSLDARQSDTLLEFENFKKKFLLANKHITKLNSTLSARIEELNAQISQLYVENLRLRASEIALSSQLKKEKEKSRKILADTECATHSLLKQLGLIRKSSGVSHSRTPTPESHPHPPRAKRPIPDPNVSPPPNRIARAPTVPVLVEDDEPNPSGPEDPEPEAEPSPLARKRKSKSRASSSAPSRLPVPACQPPSPPACRSEFDDELGKTGKRRPTRRQSGLLTGLSISTVDGLPRASSPIPDSPIRCVPDDDDDIPEPDEDEVEAILQAVTKRERKMRKERSSSKARESDTDVLDALIEPPRPRERKKHRSSEDQSNPVEGGKSKLKDVTNSQVRASLAPINTASGDRDRLRTPDTEAPTSATSMASTSTRNFFTTPATTPAMSSKPLSQSQLPTPRSSSPIPPPPQAESEITGGRERRVRKSVNYAEPKLNTKMRKPDPVLQTSSKRSSTVGTYDEPPAISSRSSSSNTAEAADPENPSAGTIKRKKSRSYVPPDDEDESEGTQADAEYTSARAGSWSSLDGRRRSVHSSGVRRIEADDFRRHSMAV
ncbi:uncharacterized protein BXZ73DRAFT_56421 [Epithele typhae]|uniref:uncharacterized protein n=1 Tax=Epithele typhae TaxID=378194 RepID=UPI002007DAE9|nr:uncharacterized protein BXZ73DRAFT_56421 [Epithele typhae]KAH9912191.1 hypothetical protein BXZ73DRAFT_56421 [Epithele typhae]